MTQKECSFDLDPLTNTPICEVHRKRLERDHGMQELSALPGPPDTTHWKCPVSGKTFLSNSNFEKKH
jgi:hypothetical protein